MQSDLSCPRPLARRVPFNLVDELIHHLDTLAEPWTVQVETRGVGPLDAERLRAAIGAALRRHPLARARRLPSSPWHCRLMWEIADDPCRIPLRVSGCPDDRALHAARAAFYSEPIALTTPPPLRVQLARSPAGDLVMLSVHHAACDGLGSVRLMLSILRAYAGLPDPVPDVDPLEVRDLAALLPRDDGAARYRRVRALLRELRRERARLAPDGATAAPGFGFHTACLSEAATGALTRRRGDGATVNDRLLAGLHLAIARWNEAHGHPCDRIAVMTPVNLRPRDRWHEVVGNFSSFVTVATRRAERIDPGSTVEAVARHTASLKRSQAAAALIEVLLTQPWQPLVVKRTLWPLPLPWIGSRVLDTAVLSNLGVVGELPIHGGAGGRATELWFSPPTRMPIGLAIGAATSGGRLYLTFRYRHTLFGPDAAERFGDLYADALGSVS